MAGGSRDRDKQVKITIVETQFVETDKANFKSVVHQFTGKHSTVAMAPHALPMRPQAQRAVMIMAQSQMEVPIMTQSQMEVPIMAQLQMEVPNASSGSEASRAQNGMVNREADFMEDLEPFLEDLFKFIDHK